MKQLNEDMIHFDSKNPLLVQLHALVDELRAAKTYCHPCLHIIVEGKVFDRIKRWCAAPPLRSCPEEDCPKGPGMLRVEPRAGRAAVLHVPTSKPNPGN